MTKERNHLAANAITVFLAALALISVRFYERLFHGFLWAEDGKIFLKQASELGIHSFERTYEGYLHLVPRLIAYATTHTMGISQALYVFPWLCAIATALTCTLIFLIASKRLQVPLAAVAGFAPLLVPSSGEVFINATNLQWIFAPLLFLLLVEPLVIGEDDQASWTTKAKWMLAFLLSATGPFAVIYVPFVALLSLANIGAAKRNWRLYAAGGLAVALQGIAMLHHKMHGKSASLMNLSHDYARKFLEEFIGTIFLPHSILSDAGTNKQWLCAAVALLFALAALLTRGRRMIATMAAISATIWISSVIKINDDSVVMSATDNTSRYFFIPAIFMMWALLLGMQTTRPSLRALPTVLLTLMVAAWAFRYQPDQYPPPSATAEAGVTHLRISPEHWDVDIRTQH
ncbi:hypothetical protein [Ralstonia solanacearum]|uniref:hypothetical protein n=1 Tax=Ralstonia solanacearum TaxID=305 RepID=UPI0001D95910|nr:hypothetical protein [Ralstonia solanacearum]CBJ44458.1 membrane protein of unknown function [Ralstonia solanacearum CFBP2957]